MNSCVIRLLLTSMPNNAERICRKLGEKLMRPAIHAVMIHWRTNSVRVASPSTLNDTYTQFLWKTQPYLNFVTRTPKSKPYNITLPKFMVLFYWWVVYVILLFCWSTPCFIQLLSYTQQFDNTELYAILTHCWGIPCVITLLSNLQFQNIAELYPILSHCGGIPSFITLLSNSQNTYIAELYPILTHC